MVGEKPKVASKLANALGNYDVEDNRGVKNYIVKTDDRKIIIAPAVGHIYNLQQISDGWHYPVFDVEWAPIFETSDGANYVKKYYNNLKDQLEKADSYINACDFDLEGCLHEDERVIVRKNDEIRIENVGNLINELIDAGNPTQDGQFEYVEPELEIIGMENWKTDFQNVEKVMRRPSDEKYLEITAFNGRKVKVSKNHPMLVATENGLESRQAEELSTEDHVLAAKKIVKDESKKEIDLIEALEDIYIHNFKESMAIMPAEMCQHTDKTRKQCLNYRYHDRMPKSIFLDLEEHLGVERKNLTVSSYKGSTRLPAKLKLDRQLGRIIGLYLAEGCIDSGGFVGFYFGPEEKELVEEVQDFLEKLGTQGKTRKRQTEGAYGNSECFEVGTKSRIFRILLKKLEVGERSGEKRLPPWILSAPEEFKNGVISGYWDGDGSLFIDKNDNRAIASAGSKSKELLEDLFYLLQTDGVNPSFQKWQHSERRMANLTVGRSKEVKKIAEKLNPSEDFKSSLKHTETSTRHGKMERLPVALAQRQELTKKKQRRLKYTNSVSTEHITNWEDAMRDYPNGDVTFLEVKKIEERETNSEYFYDFQTSSRNFQHGNGIITHNSVIGANVIKHMVDAPDERIQRMKFSTLTQGDLQKAFDNLESFDRGMTDAGLTRHTLDFFYGINVSRALMQAVRKNDRFKTLSTGRVQGPTLKVLADRERERRAFEPDDYWEIFLKHSEFDAKMKYGDDDRVWDEDEAQGIFLTVEDAETAEVTNIKVNNYKHNPPIPFNLTGLQSEASSQFNLSPKKTQSIAQTLYENSLISYPRTESQKLPPNIGYETLLEKLKGQPEYEKMAEKVLDKDKLSTTQGSKEDDAHPAIYPTGESPGNLSKQERNVYDLIVKRFFAVFGKAAKRRSLTLTLTVEDYDFSAKSKITVERNWFDLYDPYVKVEEAELPELEEGEVLPVEGFELEEKQTQPPPRYSQSRIVNELEKRNLGTKATRASTVDRLYNRNFIEGNPIEVTDLGLAIIETLENHCPNVLSEELTREFEEKMELIKNGENTSEEVIEEAQEELNEILTEFKEQEKEIGAELVETIDEHRKKMRRLGPCKVCEEEGREDGVLRMIKANGNRFVGCTNYPDCENSFPLPRNGDIKSTDEMCEECGTPKIYVSRKKGKNYSMCIDPDCPTKDDW